MLCKPVYSLSKFVLWLSPEISVAELLAALSSSEAPSYYGARIELQVGAPGQSSFKEITAPYQI